MSKALSKVGANANVVAVDLDNLDHDLAMGALARISGKVGAGGSGQRKRLFPGTSYFFKKGWKFGQGKDAPKCKAPRLVVNVAHLGMVWMRFAEENGKTFPVFSDLCIPALGQDIAARDELGYTDTEEWDTDDKGQPMDPWALNIAIPARAEDSNEYHHVLATGKTNHNTLLALFREYMEEAKLKPGQLPVVQFSEEDFKMTKKIEGKNGRTKEQNFEWTGMGYEIVDWVDAEPVDRLNQNVDLGEDGGGDVDPGEVTATARKGKAEAKPAKAAPTKATPTKAATAPTKAKPQAQKALPAPKSTKGAAPKKKVADI